MSSRVPKPGRAARTPGLVGLGLHGPGDVEVRPRDAVDELGEEQRRDASRRRTCRPCSTCRRRRSPAACGSAARAAAARPARRSRGLRRALRRRGPGRCRARPRSTGRGPRSAAPVSVAMSTIASGCSSAASARASDITRRPSASVFLTSTVVPLRMVSTSPSLIAEPDGMLSVHMRYAVTAVRQPSACERGERAEHGGGPGHVHLHGEVHGVGGLEADAARVVHDALADEGERARGSTGAPSASVGT